MNRATEIVLLVMAGGAITAGAAITFVAWRALRRLRRWRDRVEHLVPHVRSALAPESVAAGWGRAHRASLTLRAMAGTGVRRQALLQRRDLWTHLGAARTAVGVAESSGTPVGELPRMVRHLEGRARHHDRLLALLGAGVVTTGAEEAGAVTDRIVARADSVTAAAVTAMHSDGASRWADVDRAVGHEATAVADGSRRAQTLLG